MLTTVQKIPRNSVKYVRRSDILFIHLSPFTHFYGDEIEDNFFVIRRDGDDSILGFQILDYSRYSPEQVREFLSSEGYEIDALPEV